MTEKFGKIKFAADEGYNCCGQCVIFNIEELSTTAPRWNNIVPPTFSSRAEQFKDFSERIEEHLEEETEDWNMHRDQEYRADSSYGFLTMTLIKGPTPQVPGLIEHLLDHGWQCDQEVRNPKTDNIIVHLSKAL